MSRRLPSNRNDIMTGLRGTRSLLLETVFVYMKKLTWLFQGPYRVPQVYPSGLKLRPVNKPQTKLIRDAMQRIRHCHAEVEECKTRKKWPSTKPERSNQPSECDKDQSSGVGLKTLKPDDTRDVEKCKMWTAHCRMFVSTLEQWASRWLFMNLSTR